MLLFVATHPLCMVKSAEWRPEVVRKKIVRTLTAAESAPSKYQLSEYRAGHSSISLSTS